MSFATTARPGLIPRPKSSAPCLPLVSSLGPVRATAMDDEIKLNWGAAEDDGHVLVNMPGRKVAAFANTAGLVTLAVEVDGTQVAAEIDPQEAVRLVALLRDAIDDAMPIYGRSVAEFAAYEAISKAAGGAGK